MAITATTHHIWQNSVHGEAHCAFFVLLKMSLFYVVHQGYSSSVDFAEIPNAKGAIVCCRNQIQSHGIEFHTAHGSSTVGAFNISNYRAGTVVNDLDGAAFCGGADVASGRMARDFVYLLA